MADVIICYLTSYRPVRFRWHQHLPTTHDVAPPWALDNVYVGLQCMNHCGGHGVCVQGVYCQCDSGYVHDGCVAGTRHPTFLIEDFEGQGRHSLFSANYIL